MLVSIIIPCYNAEQYIAECLDSALNQKYEYIEIICVDDGSIDITLKILNEYQKKHSEKIKVIVQKNAGAPAARNKGLEAAQGEWIQFLDADDLLLPDKISRQVQLISGENFDMVAGNYILRKTQKDTKIENEKDAWIGLIKGRLGNTCSNLWRKQKITDAGMWENIKSSQETLLMFQMLKLGANVKFDLEFNTVIRNNNSLSISNINQKDNWMRYLEVRIALWKYLEETNMLTDNIFYQLKKNIYNTLRIVYKHDKKSATQFYKEYIHKKFDPVISSGTPYLYIQAYKLLGFDLTQKIFG